MDAATIREIFERHSLRWTKQREEVYAALHASETHPTADELYHLVNDRVRSEGGRADSDEAFTPISLATVYNCLEAFMKCGLCRRLASPATTPRGDGAFRYDAEMANHAHIVGADGCVIDLPDELSRRILACVPPSVVREVEQRLGVRIGRIGVELFETGRPSPHEP